MGAEIHILLDFQGHESVDVFRKDHQSVLRTRSLPAGEFVYLTAALEAEVLEYLEGSFHGEAVDVHDTGLLDDMVGIVFLVDVDSHAIRLISELDHGVDDETVVLLAVVGGNDIEAVADAEESGGIYFFLHLTGAGDILFAELVCHCFQLVFVLSA